MSDENKSYLDNEDLDYDGLIHAVKTLEAREKEHLDQIVKLEAQAKVLVTREHLESVAEKAFRAAGDALVSTTATRRHLDEGWLSFRYHHRSEFEVTA